MEVLGLQQAASDFRKASKRIVTAAQTAAAQTATRVKQVTASKVPYLTGAMRGSLETVAVQHGTAVFYNSARAPHAGPVEFGGMPGREHVQGGRYLWPTARLEAADYVQRVTDATTREVNQYPWHKQ